MKTISKLKSLLLLLVLAVGVFSCSDSEDTDYTGINSIYIRTSEDPVIIASDTTALKATLTLTRAYDQPVSLEMVVKSQAKGVEELVTIRPMVVTIPAGLRNVDFEVVSNQKDIREAAQIEISVKEPLPQNDMQVKETLRVNVKPYLSAEDLTEEQQALLEGYKNKGLDLTKWIGVIPVKVTVDVPPTDYWASLVGGMNKTYEGKSVITLSEYATMDQPVLKMTENPMGLMEFLYDILRKETVDNDEYWYGEYASEYYQIMMDLIGLSKTSVEKFAVTLDSIRVNMPQNGESMVEFLGTVMNSYEEPLTVVPFVYSYSAWERLKDKLEAGDEKALECVEYGATVNPLNYLINSSIDTDVWEDSSRWMEPTGVLKGNKLTFQFNFDHASAAGYTKITVEYILPE